MVIASIWQLLNGPNIGAIKTIRLLRPLRSVNKIKGLRIIISAMILSIPPIANVIFFLMFIIILFAVFGLHLYSGMYEYRCRLTEKPYENGSWPLLPDYYKLCNENLNNCPVGSYCGAPKTYNIKWNR